jgi:tRNA-specific 2-thiouridylase
VHNFLKDRLGENPGPVVDTKGNVIGEHKGLWFYTIGQRHGFSIKPITQVTQTDGSILDKHNIPPFYVIKKNAKRNQLVVGFGSETYQSEFGVHSLHWINPTLNTELLKTETELLVRIRHTGQLWPATLVPSQSHPTQAIVKLTSPIQGIAEGQSAVFYLPTPDEKNGLSVNLCLGGGVIANSP